MQISDLGLSIKIRYSAAGQSWLWLTLDAGNYDQLSLLENSTLEYLEIRYDSMVYLTCYVHGMGSVIRLFYGASNPHVMTAVARVESRLRIQSGKMLNARLAYERIIAICTSKIAERKSRSQRERSAMILEKINKHIVEWWSE